MIFHDRLATLVHGGNKRDVYASLNSAHSTRAAKPV